MNAIYNPSNIPVDDLAVIYGFNNGGSHGWYEAVLIDQNGKYLGGHICSDEFYMRNDLGINEGSRPDRHEHFRAEHPGGYRMEFVGYDDVPHHAGLNSALALNHARKESADAE